MPDSLNATLATRLAQLENAQLVRRTLDEDLSFLFKHALTQESAYESLLVKKRREIHRLVAQAYEQLYPERLDESAAWLAAHYAEAGEDAKVLEYATRAGDAAARIYANTEAVAKYSLALQSAHADAAPSAVQELYLKRGRALELLSRFDEAAHNYDEMQDAARQRGDRAFELAALLARAVIRAIPGSARDPEQARRRAKSALPLARELDDRRAEAKIYWVILLSSIYSGGDNDEAIESGERSLTLARELNWHEQLAYTLHDIFIAYIFRADWDRARRARLEAEELWRELDNKPMLSETITGLALLSYLRGRYDEARAQALESFNLSQEIGNLGSQGFSGFVLALAYIQLGELGEALRSLDQAIPIVDMGGMEGGGLSVPGERAWILACLGEPARARELVREAIRRSPPQDSSQQLYLTAASARIELRAGRTAEAERILREGQVKPGAVQFERLFFPAAPVAFLAAAELALAQGDYARALALAAELLAILEQRQILVDRALALWLKGQALAGLDRRDEAREVWEEGRAEAEALGERPVLWPLLLALGEAARARGDLAEAQRLFGQAREVVQFLAEHAPDPYRESFLNLPQVKQVMNEATVGRASPP